MKLIFHTHGVYQFEIEVGEFDGLLEIKAKVEETQGIPIAKQILSVNGKTLIDDFDLVCHDIEDGSRIHLEIAGDDPPQDQITLMLKMPDPLYAMNLEVDANGTILQLKEAIQVMAKVPIHRIMISNEDGDELLNRMALREIESITESDIMVEFLPETSKPSSSQPPPPPPPMPPPLLNKMSILLEYGRQRMMVEVWAEQKVKELKAKLEKMKIPEYYLTHRQAHYKILNEELTFAEQNVAKGDVIEIFPVTPRFRK